MMCSKARSVVRDRVSRLARLGPPSHWLSTLSRQFMTASGRSGRLDAMRRRPNAERARYLSALDGQVLIRPGIGDAVVEEAVRYFGARRRGP